MRCVYTGRTYSRLRFRGSLEKREEGGPERRRATEGSGQSGQCEYLAGGQADAPQNNGNK